MSNWDDLKEILEAVDYTLLDEQRSKIANLLFDYESIGRIKEFSEETHDALVGVLSLLDALSDAHYESQKRVAQVVLNIRYNPNEYKDPSAWDWSDLTDIDPEDIKVI